MPAVRAKHRMRNVRTYILVIDNDPRASRSIKDTRDYVLGQVCDPVKYFGIVCGMLESKGKYIASLGSSNQKA
jgi:hypothetical protein